MPLRAHLELLHRTTFPCIHKRWQVILQLPVRGQYGEQVGKTYSEIAEEQNINVTTVRVQMKIALTKLRESLGTPYMIAILMFL